MLKYILPLLFLLNTNLSAQGVVEPNYGLALSASGMSVFTFGVTMKPSSVVQQYSPKYGHTYVRYDSIDRQRIKSTTLIFGASVTIIGIVIQNIRNKRKKQGVTQ